MSAWSVSKDIALEFCGGARGGKTEKDCRARIKKLRKERKRAAGKGRDRNTPPQR